MFSAFIIQLSRNINAFSLKERKVEKLLSWHFQDLGLKGRRRQLTGCKARSILRRHLVGAAERLLPHSQHRHCRFREEVAAEKNCRKQGGQMHRTQAREATEGARESRKRKV